jgi:hypothetical protein
MYVHEIMKEPCFVVHGFIPATYRPSSGLQSLAISQRKTVQKTNRKQKKIDHKRKESHQKTKEKSHSTRCLNAM